VPGDPTGKCQQLLGIHDVLDHLREDDVVEAELVERTGARSEIDLANVKAARPSQLQPGLGEVDAEVADRPRRDNVLAERTVTAADVEHARARLDPPREDVVARPVARAAATPPVPVVEAGKRAAGRAGDIEVWQIGRHGDPHPAVFAAHTESALALPP